MRNVNLFITTTILSLSVFVNAQNVDCINLQEVNIPFDNNTFQEGEETYNYNLIYYTDKDEYSFWYKININADCKFKFTVLPSNNEDDYDFMLFKYTNINFCEALLNNTATPLDESFYEPSKVAQYRFTASQKVLSVKKGDVFYLSVMNIYGDDCGHKLYLEACNSSVILNSVHKPCFKFSNPTNEKTNNYQNTDKLATNSLKAEGQDKSTISDFTNETTSDYAIIVEDSVLVKGFVRDNDNGNKINAEIVFEDDVTGEKFFFNSSALDGFNITLERSRRYRLKCNSLGYYSIKGVIEFLKPSTYDFYLLKVKEGDNFVMENIYFYPSTYALKEESFNELDILAAYLEENKLIKIEIQGHTAGNNPVKKVNPNFKGMGDQWNYLGSAKKLSKLRAQTVKEYLISKGIDEPRLTIDGFGADVKLIDNPLSNEEKMLNMRVEIKVTQREQPSTDFIPSQID